MACFAHRLPHPLGEVIASNKVNWTLLQLVAAGDRGVIPPDIYRQAKRSHVSMNQNYPYIVLRKLVERGIAVKRGTKYYAKEVPTVK